MRYIGWAACVSALAFAAIVPTHAAFAKTYSADGVSTVTTDKSDVHKLAADHTVVLSSDEQTVATKKKNSPLNKASGSCFGMMDMKAGATTGSGYCSMIDAKGKSLLLSWTATASDDKGMPSGDWKLVGGEGRWSTAQGSGTWHGADITKDGKTVHTNTITGDITMK